MKQLAIILLLISTSYLSAQTVLFSEDFQAEAIGDVTGVSIEGISWSSTCPFCAAGDIFQVDNNFGTVKGFRGNDTNGPAEFTANGIDATGMYVIILDFDYESTGYAGSGNLECDTECNFGTGCSGDPADAIVGSCNNCWDFLSWEISTGTFTDGAVVLGNDCTVSDNGHVQSNPGCSSPYDNNGILIPGNDPSNLSVTITMAMWASAENMVIDNIVITGYTKAEAEAAGLIAVAGDDATYTTCPTTGTVDLFNQLNGTPDAGGFWNGPSPTTNGHLGTLDLSNYLDGAYNYIVSTGSGCQDTATVTVVTSGVLPTASVTGVQDICDGTEIVIQANGGNNYVWSDNSMADTLAINSSGSYYVVAFNSCGSDTAFFNINSLGSAPSAAVAGNFYVCNSFDSTLLTAAGGDSYLWSDGSNTNTSYNQVGNGYLVAINNCGNDTAFYTVTDESIQINISASITSGSEPLEVTFNNTTIGSTTYFWDFGNGTMSPLEEPTTTYNTEGNYSAVLTASNAFCSEMDSILIIVTPLAPIVIPNIFTPNGDGKNELFIISEAQISNITGEIYNRWGQPMYKSEDKIFAWNGRTTSGMEVPEGVYYYTLEIELINGDTEKFNGAVQLIR